MFLVCFMKFLRKKMGHGASWYSFFHDPSCIAANLSWLALFLCRRRRSGCRFLRGRCRSGGRCGGGGLRYGFGGRFRSGFRREFFEVDQRATVYIVPTELRCNATTIGTGDVDFKRFRNRTCAFFRTFGIQLVRFLDDFAAFDERPLVGEPTDFGHLPALFNDGGDFGDTRLHLLRNFGARGKLVFVVELSGWEAAQTKKLLLVVDLLRISQRADSAGDASRDGPHADDLFFERVEADVRCPYRLSEKPDVLCNRGVR